MIHLFSIKLLRSLPGIALATATLAAGPVPSREPTEWCELWIAQADQADLPRILLLGDSITRAYRPVVEKTLKGRAYVTCLSSSFFPSDRLLLSQLSLILDAGRFDVIHFNNGMHGWQHTEKEYQESFPGLLASIKQHAPGAKLIWATTTPVRQDPPPSSQPPRPSDARIVARNKIVAEILRREDIAIDDLYSAVAGHPEYHTDDIHFNQRGIDLQAAQVVSRIESALGFSLARPST